VFGSPYVSLPAPLHRQRERETSIRYRPKPVEHGYLFSPRAADVQVQVAARRGSVREGARIGTVRVAGQEETRAYLQLHLRSAQ